MPRYEFKCEHCGVVDDRWFSVAEYDELKSQQRCKTCEAKMVRVIGTPGIINTNTGFWAGRGDDDGFGKDDKRRKLARARAKAAGVSTEGKVYCPSLCRKGVPLDPQAWVSDRDDAKATCIRQGKGSEELGVKAAEGAPLPEKGFVADSIVEREALQELHVTGKAMTERNIADTKEKKRAQLSPVE